MGEKTTEIQVQLAVEWLGRSGKVPLYIALYGSDKMVESLLISLMDVINQSLVRCNHLALWDLGPLTLSRLSYGSKSATALEHFEVGFLEGPLNFASVAPISLYLASIYLEDLTLDWSTLRDINADIVFVDEALQIFSLAPQLKCCDFEYIRDRRVEARLGNKDIEWAELDDIHRRSSDYGNDNVLTAIFQATTFPKLKTCAIEYYEDFSTPVFLEFVSRSCCSITTLFLDEHGISGEDLILIADALPSITTLYLGTSQPFEDRLSSPTPFYNALCLESRYSTVPSRHHVLLPRLEDLTVETYSLFPWECLPGLRWRFHPSHDGIRTLLGRRGRPQLKSISILYQSEYDIKDQRPAYSDDSDDELLAPNVSIPDHLICDWQTYHELLILGTKVHLKLEVKEGHREANSLFSLSFERLEEAFGNAPDYIRAAMDDYKQATKRNADW